MSGFGPFFAVLAADGVGSCAIMADGIYIVDEGHSAVITRAPCSVATPTS